jgi:predicted acylesterase/phospholipase RssA
MKAALVVSEQQEVAQTVVTRMLLKNQMAGDGGPSTFDILVLSGGGDWGAFGAGVLQGWGAVAEPPMQRPVFDVVAGVSTGAIIAPMAFVGTPQTYERVFVVYQNPQPDWFRQRVLPAMLTGQSSLATNDGIAREVRTNVDANVIAAIAAGAAEHRLLLVETTNLDRGTQRIWDLTRQAQGVAAGGSPDRLHNIILASTAIPGAFPPVELDGELHVDGGVTRNIVFSFDRNSNTNVLSLWKREHPDRKAPRIRYWVVINNQISTPPERVRPRWSELSKRSLEMVVRESTVQSLQSLEMFAEIGRIEGFDVEFRFIAIPGDWRPPVEGNFKKETMVALAQLGARMGADPRSWQSVVPGEMERIKADAEWLAESRDSLTVGQVANLPR